MARRKKKSSRRWIQRAIKRPGSLRAWLKRHRAKIKRLVGRDPFNKDGTISIQVLKYLKKHPEVIRQISKSHWKRVYRKVSLAITLKRLAKKR